MILMWLSFRSRLPPLIIFKYGFYCCWDIAVSQDILKELAEVLVGKKFRMPTAVVRETIHELLDISELVIVKRKKTIKNGPDDNCILECAVSVKADYIVSGDSDLLVLRNLKKIRILTPNYFVLLNKFYTI